MFIFKFGAKILDMIMEQATKDPLYPKKELVDVFHEFFRNPFYITNQVKDFLDFQF
mgnify:CR=1 FL=1